MHSVDEEQRPSDMTPLYAACKYGHAECARLLCAADKNVVQDLRQVHFCFFAFLLHTWFYLILGIP